jgi:hypothetical protein
MEIWRVTALKRRARLKFRLNVFVIGQNKRHSTVIPSARLVEAFRSPLFLSLARCFSAGLLALLLLSQAPTFAHTPTPTPAPTPDPAKLPGTYSVVSIDPDGNTKPGSLKLTTDGKLRFKAEWTFADSKTEGIALLREDVLAIVDGPVGCRAVLYQANADGTLNGIWANVGSKPPQTQLGIEIATPSLKADKIKLTGTFDLSRREPDNGEITKGNLLISPQDDHFELYWTGGTTAYQGFGLSIHENSLGAVTTFIPKIVCTLNMLQLNEDGTLEGMSINTQKAIVNTVSTERIKDN